MDRVFEVEVICRQRLVFHVEAEDAHRAERIALERWRADEPSDLASVDAEDLVSVTARESASALRQKQDDELIMRFIIEREQLLRRLGGDPLATSISDAVSAGQAARDLGWSLATEGGVSRVDTVRAAGALDRLCTNRRLVCFERTRARSGERGEIRLYCTPEHLEYLTSEVGLDAPTATS